MRQCSIVFVPQQARAVTTWSHPAAHRAFRPPRLSPIFDIRRLANRHAHHAPAGKRREMLSFRHLIPWRNWRWRSVASAFWSNDPSLTLRELLGSLESCRNRGVVQAPDLNRLIALVKDDVASSMRFPERRGGPDTPRSMGAWRSRYNHLDRYVDPMDAAKTRPDLVVAQALSAAEYEGWPLPTN